MDQFTYRPADEHGEGEVTFASILVTNDPTADGNSWTGHAGETARRDCRSRTLTRTTPN